MKMYSIVFNCNAIAQKFFCVEVHVYFAIYCGQIKVNFGEKTACNISCIHVYTINLGKFKFAFCVGSVNCFSKSFVNDSNWSHYNHCRFEIFIICQQSYLRQQYPPLAGRS